MMKARLLKTASARELFGGLRSNLDQYRSGDFSFLVSDTRSYFEIDLEIDQEKLASIACDEEDHREVQNCMVMLDAMGGLTPYLARDERLWIYLTHTLLLNYSRKRWPIPADDDKAAKHIQTHFFIMGARGFERDDAASRLWWMAYLCARVEELSLEDALTCLLYQYDVRANIIERPTTSQSTHLFSAILRKLYESYKTDKKLFEREKFRQVMKNLNLKGGVTLIGALDKDNVEKIAMECF